MLKRRGALSNSVFTICCLFCVVFCGMTQNTAAQDEGPNLPEPPKGIISGVVTDADTNAPIAEARVLGTRPNGEIAFNVRTNEAGEFMKDRLPGGQYSLRTNKEGYKPSVTTVDVPPNLAVFVSIALEPREEPLPGAIFGRVTDRQTSEPIAGAAITIQGIQTLLPILTNENGEYEFGGLPAGKRGVSANKEGYEPQSKMVDIVAGEAKKVNFRLEPHNPIEPGAIRGRVVDAETREPIEGANVFFAHPHTPPPNGVPGWWEAEDAGEAPHPIPFVKTNPNGVYEIGNLRPGLYQLLVKKVDYRSSSSAVGLRSGETETQNFALKPIVPIEPGNLAGLVCDGKTTEPIAGAVVCIRRINHHPHDFDPRSANHDQIGETDETGLPDNCVETNNNGNFGFENLRPGHYKVRVRAEGYRPNGKIVRVVSGETNRIKIRLRPVHEGNGAIVGMVIDRETTSPLAGVKIWVTPGGHIAVGDARPEIVLGEAETNENGKYRIDEVHVGPVIVHANKEGYKPRRKLKLVREDQITTCNFALAEIPQREIGHIAGTVTKAGTTSPVRHALVILLPNRDFAEDFVRSRRPDFHHIKITDENGNYAFRHVPVGSYKLLAVKRGLPPVLKTAEVLVDEVTICDFELGEVLSRGGPQTRFGAVVGVITDSENGAPVANAWVKLHRDTDSPHAEHRLVTHTDRRGHYSFGHIPVGDYKLTAAKRTYKHARKELTVVANERARCDIELERAKQTGTLAGVVTDATTGDPIEGAHVFVPNDDMPPNSANEDNTIHTRTNENGEYELTGLPVGRITVAANHPDYFIDIERLVIRPNHENELDFDLNPRPISTSPLCVMAVSARTSQPLRGVKICIIADDMIESGSDLDPRCKRTDRQGKAIFRRAPEGEVIVKARAIGYETQITSVETPTDECLVIVMNIDPDLETSTKWWFADGDTRGGFQTFLLTINPDETETATLTLKLLFEDDDPLLINADVAAGSRFTFNLERELEAAGLENTAFAMELCSDNNIPIFAERAIYWVANGRHRGGGHDSTGATELSTDWFLAEGTTTGHRTTLILVGNPNDDAVTVTVTYLIEGAEAVVVDYLIGAERRLTINAADDVPNANFSTALSSTAGIVVERVMFGRANGHARKWGHSALGVTETSDKWLLAEGAVHNTFVTFILLANTNDVGVTATLTFLLAEGDPVVKEEYIGPLTRKTINVEQAYAEMLDQAGFSTQICVESGHGIIVERAMYWNNNGYTERSGATAVVGLKKGHKRWLLPEGAAGGDSEFENFILIGNFNNAECPIRVTFVKPDGTKIVHETTLKAFQRKTVKANDFLPTDQGTQSCSTIVETLNGSEIVVERAMYWNNRLEGHANGGIPSAE